MSTTTTSQVKPFVPGSIPFEKFLEDLNREFLHRGVYSLEKQKVSFLASCGTQVFSELKQIFEGRSLKDVSFGEITDALRKRFDGTQSDKKDSLIQGASEKQFNRSLSSNRKQSLLHINNNSFTSQSRKLFCSFCHRDGHIRRFCFDRKRAKVKFVDPSVAHPQKSNVSNSLTYESKLSYEETDCLTFSVNRINEPCFRTVYVDGIRLKMEVDCGAAVSVIDSSMYEEEFDHIPIEPCDKKLAVINGSRLKVFGQIQVLVELNGKSEVVNLIVLQSESKFIPLLGRDWLDLFIPSWRSVFATRSINQLAVSHDQFLENIKRKFPNVFDKSLSTPIKGFEADLVLKDHSPIFRRAYDVPLRLKDKVLEHLDSLEKDGVITPVDASEWASPVIVVVKKSGDIRMVIDCKVSINKVIIPNTYPLPLAQDMFASLAGAKVFCSLDLAGAYTQLKLSKKSRKLMVINTVKGLFTYNRLPQGASSSAAIFQRVMDQVLKGIDGVYCYLDDVLIAGKDEKDCLQKLYLVLERLSNANIKVNLQKCKWFVTSLPFLGHVLTDKGLLPCPEKVETIRRASVPNNVSELKAFFGFNQLLR